MVLFKRPSFYLIMAPKYKKSDAGNADTPKKSHKVLPLREYVCMVQYYLRFQTSIGGLEVCHP